jgi:regulator of protease activity HflC (stomatin/prohibitin superfamily)
MPQLPKGVLRIGILVLLGMTMVLSMFDTLEAEEAAVGQRFGRYMRREAPGLHSRLPFGLETVRDMLPTVQQVLVFESDQPASLLPFLALQRGNRQPGAPTEKEQP